MIEVAIVSGSLRVSRDFIDYPYFADLGAVQAAAVLRGQGWQVALVDAFALEGATLASLDDGQLALGASLERTLAAVPADARAILVALTPFHRPPSRDPMLADLLASLRRDRPDTPIVLADLYQSGQHVVDAAPAETLAAYPEADVFVRHEAESVLPRLFADLARPVDDGGSARRPPAPFVIEGGEVLDLDALPLPAWDLVDTERLFAFHNDVVTRLGRGAWAFPIDGASLPALTTRGCPYRCVHCSSNPASRRDGQLVAPKTQRRYSPAYLDRLFAELRRRGARRVHLLDELLNVNERHFDAVLALLEKHDLRFEVPNGMRADYILPAHLATMRGRITTLSMSAESGVQRVVDEIVDKKLDLAAIRTAAEGAAAAGIPALVHFMIGLPGETREEINATLDFALTLHEATGAMPSVQFATPLPGTRLAAIGRERGRVLPAVEDYGPCFQKRPALSTELVSVTDLERFKWTFDRRLEAMSGPKKVILNVTYKCNNHCTFCATGTREQVDGNLDRQRELLVKYRKLGVTLLDLDGGEPTLNPNLLRLIAFARRVGYDRINVTTNARMAAYDAFAQKLARSGVTSILISIHGPDAQTHAQNVGVAEAFDQTCAGARNIVRAAPAGVELGANITVTKSNHQKLAAVCDLVLDLGLRWLNIQFLTPFGRATIPIAPDTALAAREAMRVIDAYAGRMKLQVVNLPFCFMPGYEEYLVGDMAKLERHMLFVNNDEVNLFSYLAEKRVRKPECAGCPHAVFCGGVFELDRAPEPQQLIAPEDLVRPISAEVPRPAV